MIYKKNLALNEIKAKMQKMEIEQRHQQKMLLVKRKDIEEEKLKLR